jgi:predicted Zn-dependent protease
MKIVMALIVLAIAAGGAAWIFIALRKYRERKAFEQEREASFVAEMLKNKPAPSAGPAPAPPAGPVPAAAAKAPPADPLAAAAESIRAALTAGRGADAAKAFLAVVDQRTKLTLEPPIWESLGRALLTQGAYLEAAWTLHAGAALAGDLVGAQKRLVEVAARAGDAGQPQHALKLYATLLAKYPQSQYADFVRANMKAEEKKLAKG